jgi:hypothetical protein
MATPKYRRDAALKVLERVPKSPKPKPAWQREWDALWDRVAQVLFAGPAGAK